MRQHASVQIEIENKIKQLLRSALNVNASLVASSTPSTPLLGRGIGLDSVEIMALVLGIEGEFGILVPDDDMTAPLFETIGTLTDYVLHKLSESKDGAEV